MLHNSLSNSKQKNKGFVPQVL